ncbi:uncharacterized protein LOC116341728 [Contarinia nasturtii]|uniref:uncharacterized protein LOC116341728 n=1 Tax=Contarinia nasturtii TaxID=265458 RepID=UPI0012D3C3FD|nr:uncharacterized protein LOC116341728 [Contarinia nasturtii]
MAISSFLNFIFEIKTSKLIKMLYFRRLLAIALIVLAISTFSECSGNEDTSISGSSSSNTNEVNDSAPQWNTREYLRSVDGLVRENQKNLIDAYAKSTGEERKDYIKEVQSEWKLYAKGFKNQIRAALDLDRDGKPLKNKKK